MGEARDQVACLLVVVVCCTAFTSGLKLPSYMKPCSLKEPNLNECALESARGLFKSSTVTKGDRKYGVPVLDPLVIDELEINQGDLKIKYKDLKIYGLKNTEMTAVRMDLKNRKIEYDFRIPELKWVTKYSIKGKILILPITGQGNNNITLLKTVATMKQTFDLVTKKNGNQYLFVTKSSLTSELGGLSTVMDGLFNGDKLLGDHMNQFLNENWQDLAKDLQPAFNEALSEVAISIFNKLAENVPMHELFPEKTT